MYKYVLIFLLAMVIPIAIQVYIICFEEAYYGIKEEFHKWKAERK
jgi:hypothetical protein|tara:strand:- start:629 stop:763 length:135 start_codon:yes stop_codon:yes gene_type:complete